MTLTIEERKSLVIYRKERALSTMEEARDVANLRHWNLVANRLYYAIYYAQTALLISRGLTASSHAGVKILINMHFVRENLFDNNDKALMQKLFSMRQTGDYEDNYDWTQQEVEPCIIPTQQLVDKLISLINESEK